MRQPFILAAAILAAGCGSSQLSRSAGGLEVEAAQLALPETFVGHVSRAVLEVRNTARAPRRATLEATAPFAVAAGALEVGGGASMRLEVRFQSDAEGKATGTLRLFAEGETVEVELSGLARAVPECRPAGPCGAATFHPELGGCVESALPDGAPCEAGNACLEAAQCASGECVGTARSCDDGDRCTADACDAAQGCVHLEAKCPVPADPCRVATCEKAAGCGTGNAPDGTACGPSDCTTARVCLQGVCREVAVPEGATCAPESPCQGKGTCHAQLCERPAATPLVPAWSYPVPGGSELYFNGLADGADNLYWAECSSVSRFPPAGCDLVSATPGGFVRYRVPLAGPPPPSGAFSSAPGLLVLVGDLVVSALSQTSVEARRAFDGAPVWKADLHSPLGRLPDDALGLGPIVDDGHGGLYVGAQPIPSGCCSPGAKCSSAPATLVSLATATGAVRWMSSVGGQLFALAADDAGNAYATGLLGGDGGSFSGVASYTSNGAERWRAGDDTYVRRLAIAAGRVAVSGKQSFFVAADGGSVIPASGGVADFGPGFEPLLGATAAHLLGRSWAVLHEDYPLCYDQLRLRKLALADASLLWDISLFTAAGPEITSSQLSEPVLAANGDLLFAHGRYPFSAPGVCIDPAPALQLGATTSAGQRRFSCELPGTVYDTVDYRGPAALLKDRWVVVAREQCFTCTIDPPPVLRAFDLPGYELAPQGWVTAGGSNRRSGRPR